MSMARDIGELTGEAYLSAADVDARIGYLLSTSRPAFSDGELQERQEELDELTRFRDEVCGQAGAGRWNSGMTLVSDRKWDEFAVDEAENLYGHEAVVSDYFRLDAFTRDLQAEDYQDAWLDGCQFWYRIS